MITILIVTLLITALSCSRNNGPLPTKLLVGINDTAIYHLDRDGRAVAVEKKVYSIPGELVYLHRDTVELGEEFHANFGVYKDTFEIVISKPSYSRLTREDFDKLPKETGLSYSFKTTQKGTFDFEGEIRHDTIVRPFKWKFIVN
jgi:hypothetical protein